MLTDGPAEVQDRLSDPSRRVRRLAMLGGSEVMELVSKYPDKLRERAVRMVAEVRPQYPLQ